MGWSGNASVPLAPHWLWWAVLSAHSMLWNYAWSFYCDSKQLDQHKGEEQVAQHRDWKRHLWYRVGGRQEQPLTVALLSKSNGTSGTTTPRILSSKMPQWFPSCQLYSITIPATEFQSVRRAHILHSKQTACTELDTWAYLNASAVFIDQRQSVVVNSSCFIIV